MQLLIPASEEFMGFVLLIPLGGACGGDFEDLEKLARNKISRRRDVK